LIAGCGSSMWGAGFLGETADTRIPVRGVSRDFWRIT
jgi:hypothetical protein